MRTKNDEWPQGYQMRTRYAALPREVVEASFVTIEEQISRTANIEIVVYRLYNWDVKILDSGNNSCTVECEFVNMHDIWTPRDLMKTAAREIAE